MTKMQATDNPELNQRVQQQVNLRVMTTRRRRVWLQLGLFVVVSAGLVVAVMVRRDQLALERCRRGAEAAATALQADVLARRPLPVELPIDEHIRGHFHYRPLNSTLFGMGKPVGVCCCTSAHNLFLVRSNGRHVVVNDGDKLTVRWVTEEEFAANATAWNLNPSRIR